MIDYSKLTPRQREVMELVEQGLPYREIADKLQCSKQNVYGVVSSAKNRSERPEKAPKPRKKPYAPKKPKNTYAIYAGRDLSGLSPTEHKYMIDKISGMTYQEIADKYGCSASAVGVILKRAREKLNGTYVGGAEYARKYIERIGKEEVQKRNARNYAKNREKRIEKMREYNKEYYRKHREEILRKQKENKK